MLLKMAKHRMRKSALRRENASSEGHELVDSAEAGDQHGCQCKWRMYICVAQMRQHRRHVISRRASQPLHHFLRVA